MSGSVKSANVHNKQDLGLIPTTTLAKIFLSYAKYLLSASEKRQDRHTATLVNFTKNSKILLKRSLNLHYLLRQR